ncbi:MAG: hypothetical protein WCD86_12770 [Ktedonobacteraceae bacterium]
MQDNRWIAFFQKLDMLLLMLVNRWFTFLYPPVPVRAGEPLPDPDEGSDAKLPGLPVLLQTYKWRVIDIGGVFVITGICSAFELSQTWPFLVGSGVNLALVLLMLRYRFQFRWQYPLIARQCTIIIGFLLFIEALFTLAFVIVTVFIRA